MSDSEDDYNSGEDGDYVPSGDDVSDNDYDEKDCKNFETTVNKDEDNGAKRKKIKKCSFSNRNRKGGIKINDVTENSEKSKLLTDKLTSDTEQKLEENKKERADSLWSHFLKDVGQPANNSKVKEPAVSTSSASLSDNYCDDDLSKKSITTNIEEKKTTVTITKLFDFAGETVEVKEEVDSKDVDQSLEETTEKTSTSSGLGIKRPHGGLGNLLNKLSKKSKISTLEKSKLDWNSFKQQEGIEDDLKLHNKGKNGFLEKRDFLDRANHRQYEIEKTFRLGLKKSTR